MKRVLYLILVSLLFNFCSENEEPQKIVENRRDSIPDRLPLVITKEILSVGFYDLKIRSEIELDYGLIVQDKGICWSKTSNPTIEDSVISNGPGAGSFISKVTNLDADSTYYVRSYALNENGLSYGSIFSVKTESKTVKDLNGTTYPLTKIFDKIWMARNMTISKFNNGDPILRIDEGYRWARLLDTSAFTNYSFNSSYANTYGHLYNYNVVDDERNICPEGFRIATIRDWQELKDSLANSELEIEDLRDTPFQYWDGFGGTNTTGFTARGSGYLNAYSSSASFSGKDNSAYYWAADTIKMLFQNNFKTFRMTRFNLVFENMSPNDGASIRCVKD